MTTAPTKTLAAAARWLAVVLGLAVLLPASPAAAAPRLVAYASVAPVAFLVQRVGGDRVQARSLLRPGQEPHGFEPTPRQVARLGEARVYFSIGLPFEAAMLRRLQAANPGLRVVAADAGIHRRSADGHHPDPHVWLSPTLAARLAANIAAGLTAIDPAGRSAYQAGLAALTRELKQVRRDIARRLARFKGRSVLVYHPAFGYFLGEFGLKQIAVQNQGKEPGPRGLARLIDQARRQGIRVIFVQAQFPTTTAHALARATGARVAALDPLAADYLANLKRMAEHIAAGLGRRSPAGGRP